METKWFWVVIGPADKEPKKHEDFDKAQGEAERRAEAMPGKTFYVAKATHAACTRTPVAFVETDDGIPF